MRIKICLILGVWLTFAVSSWAEVGNVQITFKISDDFGKPVPGVTVGIAFVRQKSSLIPLSVNNAEQQQINATTDTNGMATLSGSLVFDPHVSYGVHPLDGYYYTSGGDYVFQKVESGRWQPWNPTVEIVLKPILNPVPMYAENTPWSLTLPEIGRPIGYDLMIGDWVAPYGKGLTNDFIFALNRQFTNVNEAFNATLKLAFSNVGDGIQPILVKTHSALRSPRFAPEDGYEPQLILRKYRERGKPIVDSFREDQNWFFRVRTLKKDGKIVSALYGKIYGDIKFQFFDNPTARLEMTYYLNPEPNSRNMEFNVKSNLVQNLKPTERVSAP